MTIAIHHLHKRKRIHEKHEKYPHPDKWKRFLDKLVYVMGIVAPMWVIPQIIKIWRIQDSSGVALITWAAYLFGAMVLFMYAFSHKEKPLIMMYGGLIIVDLSLIISILIFR